MPQAEQNSPSFISIDNGATWFKVCFQNHKPMLRFRKPPWYGSVCPVVWGDEGRRLPSPTRSLECLGRISDFQKVHQSSQAIIDFSDTNITRGMFVDNAIKYLDKLKSIYGPNIEVNDLLAVVAGNLNALTNSIASNDLKSAREFATQNEYLFEMFKCHEFVVYISMGFVHLYMAEKNYIEARAHNLNVLSLLGQTRAAAKQRLIYLKLDVEICEALGYEDDIAAAKEKLLAEQKKIEKNQLRKHKVKEFYKAILFDDESEDVAQDVSSEAGEEVETSSDTSTDDIGDVCSADELYIKASSIIASRKYLQFDDAYADLEQGLELAKSSEDSLLVIKCTHCLIDWHNLNAIHLIKTNNLDAACDEYSLALDHGAKLFTVCEGLLQQSDQSSAITDPIKEILVWAKELLKDIKQQLDTTKSKMQKLIAKRDKVRAAIIEAKGREAWYKNKTPEQISEESELTHIYCEYVPFVDELLVDVSSLEGDRSRLMRRSSLLGKAGVDAKGFWRSAAEVRSRQKPGSAQTSASAETDAHTERSLPAGADTDEHELGASSTYPG